MSVQCSLLIIVPHAVEAKEMIELPEINSNTKLILQDRPVQSINVGDETHVVLVQFTRGNSGQIILDYVEVLQLIIESNL